MTRKEFIEYYQSICQPMSAMMRMAPKDKLDWKPTPNSWTLGQLLQHCTTTPGPLVFVIKNSWPPPEAMQKMMAGSLSIPKMTGKEALAAFETNKNIAIAELTNLSDADFNNKQTATPFGTSGTVARILQSAADHQNNHKHDLFIYLKHIGLPVNTMTLFFGKTA